MSVSITRRTAVAGLAGLAASALAAPHVARAAVRTVQLGHNSPAASHYGQGSISFASAVAANPVLASVLRIDVHHNGEMGDELGMLKDCVKGSLDMMMTASATTSSMVPENGVLNAPFLFRDVMHARAAFDGAVGQEYIETARQVGVNIIAWGENGLRHITANRPIRTLADLHGLKIRVPPSTVMQDGFRAMGADPGQLSFNMLREALKNGDFDAQENAIVLVETMRFHEIHSHVSLTGHIYDAAPFIASSDLLEELSEAQQAALRACAQIGAATTRDVSSAAERDGLARLRTAGMIVVDDVHVAELRAASRPYLESLVAGHGTRMQRLVAAGA